MLVFFKRGGDVLLGISRSNSITGKRTGTLELERTLQTLDRFYLSCLIMDKSARSEPLCPQIENGDNTSYIKFVRGVNETGISMNRQG